MNILTKILGIAILAVIFSCQQKQSEESKAFDSQMKETIQIHDDVMPKMSEINSLITKLKAQKEEIEAADEVDSDEVEMHENAIKSLEEAHDLMMSWMKNFSNSFSRTEINTGLTTTDKDSIKAKQSQLDNQYQSAREMQKAITDALENAQKILSE